MPDRKIEIDRRGRDLPEPSTAAVHRIFRRRDDRLLVQWATQESRARMIVADDLRAVWMNDAACRAIAAYPELGLRGDALMLLDSEANAGLAEFVAGCTADSPQSVCFPMLHGEGHIIFRGQRITAPDPERAVGLTFFRSVEASTPVHSLVVTAFKLTPTEHRVLLGLAEGLPADAVADKLAISLETARSHIRHIYQKLSVTSREALFRRIRPYLYSA